MPTNNVLLVLIARDAGMRSSLAARLSMSGVDLLTVEAFDDPRIGRGRPRRVVLVADEGAVDGHDLDSLIADSRWFRLVLVSDASGADEPGLTRIAPKNAAATITAMIASWQAET